MAQNPDLGMVVGFIGMQQYLSDLNRYENQTTQSADRVKKSTGGMRQAWEELRNEFPLIGRAASLARNPIVLLGAAVAGTIGIFAKGVSAASEFGNQFLELQNLNIDKTADQMQAVRASIISVASSGLQSAKDISKAFFDVQSGTGLFGAEVQSVVMQVAQFATATKADFDSAVNQAVKGMRAWGFEAKELNTFLASSFATVQVGITTFAQLADVQVRFANAASAAGQSADEANKVFAAFTQAAEGTAEAATLTKTAFADLGKGNTVAGLKRIGIKVWDEATGSMRNASDIISDIVAKFKTLSRQDISELKDEIGGSDGLRALLDVAKNQGDKLLETFSAFDEAKKNFDLETLLENAKGDFTTLSGIVKNQVNTVFITLGEAILPIIARVLDTISGLLPGVIDFFGEWGGVIQVVTIAFGAMGVVVLAVKGYVNALSLATAAYNAVATFSASLMATLRTAVLGLALSYNVAGGGIKGAAVALKTFATSMRISPVGAFITGIVGLTAAVGFLVSRLKNTNDQSTRLKELSRELADRVGKETAQVNRLFSALKDENTGKEDKKKLVDLLLSQYGKYLGNLANEKDLLNNIEEAQKRVNDAIEEKVVAQLKAEKQEDLFAQRTERRLKALGDIASVRPGDQVPLSQDVFSDFVTRRAEALRLFKEGADGAKDALVAIDKEITNVLRDAQAKADQNISFSTVSGLIRKASTDIADIDKELIQIDQDFAALGAQNVPQFTDAVNESADAMRYAGIVAEKYAKNSITGVGKELSALRKKFEAEEFGTVRWRHLAAAVSEVEIRLEMMKAAAEGPEKVMRRFLPQTSDDLKEQIEQLVKAQDGVEKYSDEWYRLKEAIEAATSERKAFEGADAIILGEAISVPRREAEGLNEAIQALGTDASPVMLGLYAAMQTFGDGTVTQLSYIESRLLDFKIRMIEIGQELKTQLTQAFGEAFFAFGKAIGEGAKAGDAFRTALIGLGQVVLSEVPKYLGLFLLETAVGLGFPVGIPFALAGIGLLAFSGLAAGLLSRLGGGAAGENAVATPEQPQVSTPQTQAAQGLSSINGADGEIGVRIYIGNEEVTNWTRYRFDRDTTLTGG